MSNSETPEQPQSGQVYLTPEAGPIDLGAPSSAPGAGQIQATPEAGPLGDDQTLSPPTWRENMKGPILGLDDVQAPPRGPASTGGDDRPEATVVAAKRVSVTVEQPADQRDEPRGRQWPSYTGKPVTDVSEALRYVAPIASQAEKLAIQAIDLSARGLAGLARYLEARREERNIDQSRDSDRLK